MHTIVELIKTANPDRNIVNIKRRLCKFEEEKGEVNEAMLNVTSIDNLKKKTWDDVREELVDCFIVAIDIALTFNPDMNFDFHIRHIDNFEEEKFEDKLLLTGHLLYSLNNLIKNPDKETENCVSKSLAILIFELATLIFPDKTALSENEIYENFYQLIIKKTQKWINKGIKEETN